MKTIMRTTMETTFARVAKIAIIITVFFVAFVLFETFTLSVERVDVYVSNLPAELDGFRIVQITDLHGRRFNPDGRITKETLAAKPDLIAATGDYIHRNISEVDHILPLIKRLAEIAPIFAVSGNHDYWASWPTVAMALTDASVTVLENTYVEIYREGQKLIVAGVSDSYTGRDDLNSALPIEIDAPVVLLAHSPTWFEPQYVQRNAATPDFIRRRELLAQVDLTLSGHTHGGQIKIPFIGPLTTASGQLFPKTHVEGLIREETGWLYISRGLGQGGLIAIRFLSRPELTILTMRRQE